MKKNEKRKVRAGKSEGITRGIRQEEQRVQGRTAD